MRYWKITILCSLFYLIIWKFDLSSIKFWTIDYFPGNLVRKDWGKSKFLFLIIVYFFSQKETNKKNNSKTFNETLMKIKKSIIPTQMLMIKLPVFNNIWANKNRTLIWILKSIKKLAFLHRWIISKMVKKIRNAWKKLYNSEMIRKTF